MEVTQIDPTTVEAPPSDPVNQFVKGVRKKYYPNKTDEEVAKALYASPEAYRRTLDQVYNDNYQGKQTKQQFLDNVKTKYGDPFPEPVQQPVKKKDATSAPSSTTSSSGSADQVTPPGVTTPNPVVGTPPAGVDMGDFMKTANDALLAFKNKPITAPTDNTRVTPAAQTSAYVADASDKKQAAADLATEAKYRKQYGNFWGGVHLGVNYATSKLATGGSEALRGITTAANILDSNNPMAPANRYYNNVMLDELDEKAKMGVDPNYNQHGIVGAIGGVLQTVPALLASESTGGASFFFQGLGAADKQVNELKKQGVKFDNHTDDLYRIGSGIINYGLTKIDAGPLLNNTSSSLKNNVVGQLVAEGVNNLGTKLGNATSEDVTAAFMKPVMNFNQKLKQFGGDYLNSFVHNTAVMGAMAVADHGLKATVNVANDKAPFKQDLSDLGERLKNILTVDAPLFSTIGAATNMGKLFKDSPYANTVVQDLQKDSSPENVNRVKTVLTNIGLEKGWGEKEINDTNRAVDLMADVANKVPKNIPPSNFGKAVDLVMNRRGLENVLDYTQKNKGDLDPAIADKATAYETLIKTKIEQANDKLAEVITGKNYEYFAKDGKYYKQVPGETIEEISKDRFDLENGENTTREQSGINDTENVVPGGPPVTVSSAGKKRSLDDEDVEYLKNNGSPAVKSAIDQKEDNVTLDLSNDQVAADAMAALEKRDQDIKDAEIAKNKAQSAAAKPAESVSTPAPSEKPVEAQVEDAFDSLKKPVVNEEAPKTTDTTSAPIETPEPVAATPKEAPVKTVNEKPEDNTIKFKESKLQQTLYHGSDEPIDKFKPSDTGIYFSEDKDYWPSKKYIYSAKVDARNPHYGNTSFIDKKPEENDSMVWTKQEALDFFKDEYEHATPEGKKKLDRLKSIKDIYEAVVFHPDQIHITGVEERKVSAKITPARQKAIDAVTHGIVVPENIKEGDPSARFDFGMSVKEKRKALADIHAGDYETAPARKMLDKLEEFEKNDDYPVIQGLGGAAVRNQGATSADIQQGIDEAKKYKLDNGLTPEQIEKNNAALADLGFTHEDAQNYENYRRSEATDFTDGYRRSLGRTKNDVRAGSDEAASTAQSSGDQSAQTESGRIRREPERIEPYYVSTPEGHKEVTGEPVPNNHGLDLFVHSFDELGGKGYGVSEGSTGLQIGKGLTKQDAIDNALEKINSKSSTEMQGAIEKKREGGLQSPRGIKTQSIADNIDALSDEEKEAANSELEKEGLTLQDIKDYELSKETTKGTGSTANDAEDLRQRPADGAGNEIKVGSGKEVQNEASGSEGSTERALIPSSPEITKDGELDQNSVIRDNSINDRDIAASKTPERTFIDRVGDSISKGEKLNIIALRKLASELGIVGDDIKLQDLAETAVVSLGRSVALDPELTDQQKLDKMVDLYNNQPSFLQRSSDRIALAQYSTPLPTAFIGGLYGKAIKPYRIFEPSAGNGLLTVDFDPRNVIVNEIDKNRLANLNIQGFRLVSNRDAAADFGSKANQDVVIANPPFGKSAEKVYDGYRVSGLDEQMIINALQTMKDNGRGIFIMGGHNKYDAAGRLASDRTFFNYLYSHYNVSDVINMDGALFKNQGTTFPNRMILINGRKSTVSGVSPLKDDAANKPVSSFQELYDRVQTKILSDENRNLLQPGVDAERNNKPLVYGADTFVDEATKPSTVDTIPENKVGPADTGSDTEPRERTELNRGSDRSTDIGNEPEPGGRGASGNRQLSTLPGDNEPVGVGQNEAVAGDQPGRSDSGLQRDRPQQDSRELADQLVTHDKVPYQPASNSTPVGSVIPSNMATEAKRTLQKIEYEHGNIDVFVSSRLGYPSREALYNAFSAEQVDALAMGIAQMEAGQGMIIGDMTGVGKGRIAAGMVRYGIKTGKMPIFMTEKATLFSDLYRDLVDIGSAHYVPFIINDKSSDNDPTITDANGTIVHKVPVSAVKTKAYANGQIPNGYDFIMATYSQFTSSKPSDKKTFLQRVSADQPMIMDESHNVSGTSNSGEFFQDVLQNVQGVMYLSATFAKRPDNMPVYAGKTAMSEANMSHTDLVEAIRKGGVALQEIVSSQLVESGQMLRRERDFTGVKNNFIELSHLKKDHRDTADKITDIVRDIISFQRSHVNDIINSMDEEAAANGAMISKRLGTASAGVDNVPFSSKVFNVIDQMLFAIKAESVADRAIEHLKNNLKPVIAFKSTMESFLKNSNIEVGDTIEKPNFALSLSRGLKSAMTYTETNPQGDKVKGELSVSELTPEGQDAYNAIVEKIKSASVDISISPIDVIIKKIQDAGYKVGEITGRKMQLEFQPNGSANVKARDDRDIKKIVRQFNNGEGIDVVLLNSSGATGLSMHASKTFKDQRQRVMLTHQLELDINKEIQKRGRIDRSGQVVRGIYDTVFSAIPAEQRLAMMFKAKLKSLDANTTSSQKSKTSEEIGDFLNKYGDKVVVDYLKENPELNEALLDPFGINEMDQASKDRFETQEGAAHKVTGRVAILPSGEQAKFYDDVTNRYLDLIQYLDDNNLNDLEVKSVPLDAETVESKPYIVGKGGNSPFGRDSILETVKSNILKKPLSKDELEEQITENLQGVTAAQKQKVLVNTLGDFYSARIKMTTDAIKERYADKRKKVKTTGDTEAYANQLQTLTDLEKYEVNERESAIEKDWHNMERVFESFRVGEEYDVPNTISSTGTTYSRGVFLGFDLDGKGNNPFAPSRVKMRFAVLDGRRVVQVPLSQNDFVNAAIAGKMQMRMRPGEGMRADWGNVRSNNAKETRHIITGNILQAYNGKGQLVAYTTSDGQLKKGILMPSDFKPEKTTTVPATRALKTIVNLGQSDTIFTSDKTIGIQKLRGDRYNIQVAAAKSTGGLYFLDPDLRSIVDGNNFNTIGGKMVGEFDQVLLPKLLTVLQNKFGKTFKVDDAGDSGPSPSDEGGTNADYIFDQSNIKSVLEFLDKLKIKAGRAFSSLVPIPPVVFNKAIDMIKAIVKVTNSAQKAVRVAVRYLKDNKATKDQISSFVQEMQDFFENTPALKKMFAEQAKGEDSKTALQSAIDTTMAEAEQSIQTGLTNTEIGEYRTKLTDILAQARKMHIIKYGEASASKAAEAIRAVNEISRNNPESVQTAVRAVSDFFNNVGDKTDLKQANAARAQLRPFVNKKENVLPGSLLKDLVMISPDSLSTADLKEYKEITSTLAEQLNGSLPGLIPNDQISAFTDRIKTMQEDRLKAKLAKQYADFGATEDMSLDELTDIKNAAAKLAENDQQEPVEKVNKKRAILNMFIDDARANLQSKIDNVEPEYRAQVEDMMKLSTDNLSTGEMKLYNQVLNNVAINNDYQGVGLFQKYHESDRDMQEFTNFAAPYQNQFRQISFGQFGKDLVKGSTLSKLSLTDKFFHVNSEREVGNKLDSMLAFPINQGYQGQQQDKAKYNDGFREIVKKNGLKRDNMFRVGVFSDLNEHDLSLGTTKQEQFEDGVERLRQAVDRLRPFKTKHENAMFTTLSGIYDQVKAAASPADLSDMLTPEEKSLYDYTQGVWNTTYPKLKENTTLYSFDDLGSIENYAHRKYYNVGGKIDVNLIDNNGIDVRTGSTTGEANTKIGRTVRRTLPAGKIIDYNIFNSFSKGLNETLNDIHTLGSRIKANRMLKSKELPGVIDISDRYKKTNTEILTDGVKLMVNIQRGMAKSDADLYGVGPKVTNWIRQAFYAHTTGQLLAAAPQYASSIAFVLPQLENPKALWMSMKMFGLGAVGVDKEFRDLGRDLMHKVGGGTINRDLQGDQQLNDQLNNAAETLFGQYTNENLSEVIQKLHDAYFYSLKLGDRAIALHTWMAGYVNSLIKQGVIGKTSEFTKEFLQEHLNNPNQLAATEAEALVTMSNNESDSSRRPEQFVNKTGGQEFLNDILYPLKKFAVSMYNKLMLGIRNVSEHNGGEVDGAKLIIGAIASSVVYGVISKFILGPVYDKEADLAIKLAGEWDHESQMLERHNLNRDILAKQKFEQAKFNLVTSTVSDIFLNGQNAVVENGVKATANLIYQGVVDTDSAPKSTVDAYGNPIKSQTVNYVPQQLFYSGNNYSEMMGVYADTPLGVLFDIPTDKHNAYNVLHEQFKYKGWAGLESKRILFSLGIPTLSGVGLLPADVNRVNDRVKKRMEKLFQIEKEFTIKYKNKDNLDYQESQSVDE